MNRIQEIIRRIEFLPPIPLALQKALRVIDDPNAAPRDVLPHIQYDTVLSANLLKMCNSPYFALPRRISSLREAVAVLGMQELKRLILIVLSRQVYNGEYPGYESSAGELLRHSMAAAVIAGELQAYAPPLSEDLFTAALLHDVGKILLSHEVADLARQIHSRVSERRLTFVEAEIEVLGMSHAEAGALVLERWNFPSPLVQAVRHHHQPQNDISPLTHFTALADILAQMLGFATDHDALQYRGYPELYKPYGIREKHLEAVITHALGKIQEVERVLA